MCGIAGVLGSERVDPNLVVGMRDSLAHRGPDAAGLWSSPDGRACLGHRRLTIIDPSPEANQPFLSGDGRLAIVLNGEIYNFRTLREELASKGAVFRTRSDTEVLVEAYRAWGSGCLERLSGMFAFAIWDEDRRLLFCARDRAGEKPFHYAWTGRSFAFASELKALEPWAPARSVDWTAVADFLTLGFVPDPKTVWEGTFKLPPAHWLEVELLPDGPVVGTPRAYWDFELEPDDSDVDWEEAVRSTLTRAAAEMTVSDAPVGTFLSGGVDSSSVTAALCRGGQSLAAFTIGFEESDYDERRFAAQVAAQYEVRHVERTVVPEDVGSVFRDTMLWHYDEPFNDYSYLPTYYLCREARSQITVALSGDGGDELFAGYGKYAMLARRVEVERAMSRPVAQLVARGADGLLGGGGGVGQRVRRYRLDPAELVLSTLVLGIPIGELRRVARGPLGKALDDYDPLDSVRRHVEAAPPDEVGLVDSMRYVDVKTTLASILTKVDRASMAVALEVRPVYLNREVLDLARRIPGRLLASGRVSKALLKRALEPWLPHEILYRPKMGFAMPLRSWLRDGRALSGGDLARVRELVDPSYVDTLRAEHLGGADRTSALHGLHFLEGWLERWDGGRS